MYGSMSHGAGGYSMGSGSYMPMNVSSLGKMKYPRSSYSPDSGDTDTTNEPMGTSGLENKVSYVPSPRYDLGHIGGNFTSGESSIPSTGNQTSGLESAMYGFDDHYCMPDKFSLTDIVAGHKPSSNQEHFSTGLYGLDSPYIVGKKDNYKEIKEEHGIWHSSFLDKTRDTSENVEDSYQIIEYVHDIFRKVTGQEFPSNIEINVLEEEEFKRTHDSVSHNATGNILGFALNRNSRGKKDAFNQIFIKRSRLAEVLVVAGHEIGHVLSERLPDIHDEEAKAFAFEYEWACAIRKYDFAGLKDVVRIPKPASNGLHDIASSFVFRLIDEGKRAVDIFKDLMRGELSVRMMFPEM